MLERVNQWCNRAPTKLLAAVDVPLAGRRCRQQTGQKPGQRPGGPDIQPSRCDRPLTSAAVYKYGRIVNLHRHAETLQHLDPPVAVVTAQQPAEAGRTTGHRRDKKGTIAEALGTRY